MQPTHRGGPVEPLATEVRPLGPDEIMITGGFWSRYKRLNAETIVRHCDEWMERIGWTGNFDHAAQGDVAHTHSGIEFVDSEIYKLLEAMAWQLAHDADPRLESRYAELVGRVSRAQEPDGYLHTSFGREGQPARYSNLEWGHELYCFGHLLQAAVARLRTGHDDQLPAVGRRLADHLVREFGAEGRVAVCGHPEIEMALVEFSRATGESKYRELARLFIDRRGTGTLRPIQFGAEYFQDDVPVRDADVLRGHAVRALYLASGAVDVAVDQGDGELLDAVRRQWRNTSARRRYLTGGVGSHHLDEAFGADYELPPDRAYSETCAGIASIMLNWRLLLAGGSSAQGDAIERTLLNNVLASTRADGRAFFYTNTLHQRAKGAVPPEDVVIDRAETSLRAPWFWVSCCPTNVARTLAGVEFYFATSTANGLQLHQYGDYRVETVLDSGAKVGVQVASGYPYDGEVRITFTTNTPEGFALELRVPDWAKGATLTSDAMSGEVLPGTARVERRFSEGDVVVLRLPMGIRRVAPHPRIDAVRGQIAFERGPLVLCLESPDLPSGIDTEHVEIDDSFMPTLTERGARALLHERTRNVDDAAWPYGPPSRDHSVGTSFDAELIPYFSWANRGPSTMRVWIPTHTGK